MSLENFVPDLSKPSTIDQLARALGIATDVFNLVLGTDDPSKLYERHLIPKRATPGTSLSELDVDGITTLNASRDDLTKYRVVWEPKNAVVKHAHRSAARVLGRFLSKPGSNFPHPCAFGYIKHRSTRDNAKQHVGAKLLLGADIHNFFPSISTARVEVSLGQAGINQSVAGPLARFLCIDNSLPLGLNSSPLIANLVALPLDVAFQALAMRIGCTYTRYADDITFSSMKALPSLEDIEGVLSRNRFKLNRSKFRLSKRGQKHYVTGLSVSSPDFPHTPKRLKHRLRQELHFIERFGLTNHLSKLRGARTRQHHINRIDGTVSYVASIEPRIATKLRQQWTRICEAEEIERSFEPRPTRVLRRAEWFIDEAEFSKPDGTKLLALCVAEILDPRRLMIDLISLFADEAGDAFGTDASIAIIQKGLHWQEANWSQRERVVKLLATSPIRAMVAFAELSPGDYQAQYLQLLRRVLDTAMKTADDATVSIVVESNSSKISKQAIVNAINSTFLSLETRNQRRPIEPPNVSVHKKGALPTMCVPDVLLGALGRYAASRGDSKDSAKLPVTLFERLRNHYGVIFDDHAGTIYHARRPFQRW